MAKNKGTDLLKDPLVLAQKRYREQIEAFNEQYGEKAPDPLREMLKEEGISLKDWQKGPTRYV